MIFEHKGLILQQEETENHHYMIFRPTGEDTFEIVFHASYEGELFTEEEAKEHIEYYLSLAKMVDDSEEILYGEGVED